MSSSSEWVTDTGCLGTAAQPAGAASGQRLSAAPPGGERSWCIVVPHHARGARVARHRLAGELRASVSAELLADAVAVIAELVGNAIRHARPLPGDVIRVAWRVRAGDGQEHLYVRVTDGGGDPQHPRERVAGLEALDGRGLAIVASLARAWGVDHDGLGQSVWAELSLPPRIAADGTGAR